MFKSKFKKYIKNNFPIITVIISIILLLWLIFYYKLDGQISNFTPLQVYDKTRVIRYINKHNVRIYDSEYKIKRIKQPGEEYKETLNSILAGGLFVCCMLWTVIKKSNEQE